MECELVFPLFTSGAFVAVKTNAKGHLFWLAQLYEDVIAQEQESTSSTPTVSQEKVRIRWLEIVDNASEACYCFGDFDSISPLSIITSCAHTATDESASFFSISDEDKENVCNEAKRQAQLMANVNASKQRSRERADPESASVGLPRVYEQLDGGRKRGRFDLAQGKR
jgi:hypothetical protein